jgi:Flp pilus assembly pilin Flp
VREAMQVIATPLSFSNHYKEGFMENSSLVGSLTNAVKDHSKAFGLIGVVIGAILVIYYCGSINFYPSGLTIADTLFFLWVVAIFGFYYSAVAFAFFIASTFWVAVFARPINFILKLAKNKTDIVIPLPKSDWFMVFGGGLIANLLILGASYINGHPLISVFGALFLIGFLYTLIENVSNNFSSSNKLLDAKGQPINVKPIDPQLIKNIFYVLIYAAPLLLAQVGGSVTRTTFETMGVRQEGVDLYIEVKEYKSILNNYEREGLISGLECGEVCIVKNVNILFTNIGTNTKLEMRGKNGSIQLVLPTKVIKLTAQSKPNKTLQPTAAI